MKKFAPRTTKDCVVYISNLTFDKDERGVRNLFNPFGRVMAVKIVMDLERERSKGFAFVTMKNPKEAQAAIKYLNGKVIDGRTVKASVAIAQEREQEERPAKKIEKKKIEPAKKKATRTKRPEVGLQVLFDHLKTARK